jgi:hypothetical protein
VSGYRAGQRVRVEHTGTLSATADGLWICWDDLGAPGPMLVDSDGKRARWIEGATVTVIAEPRPEEPTGLGAVVEAGYKDHARQKWVSNRGDSDGPRNRWTSIPYWGFLDWDCLIDPVVLAEGWTP